MTVGRSNSTACAPARRVSRPQGVRPRLTISVTPSAEERQQASVNGSGQRYPPWRSRGCCLWAGCGGLKSPPSGGADVAEAAGIERRVTAHSGRVGLASELTSRGASIADVMLAGNWKTSRMVAH